MNKGIKYSKGKVIIFVNSGDLLDRNALKFVHREFSKDLIFLRFWNCFKTLYKTKYFKIWI